MSVILSLLGIAVAAAGVAAIGFGIPINEFTLGTTLIVAGVGALTGGLVLIGLGAVVAELGRLSETIRTRLVVRPQVRAEAPELAQPAPAPANLAGAPVPMVSTRPAQPAPARARSEAAQAPQALDISGRQGSGRSLRERSKPSLRSLLTRKRFRSSPLASLIFRPVDPAPWRARHPNRRLRRKRAVRPSRRSRHRVSTSCSVRSRRVPRPSARISMRCGPRTPDPGDVRKMKRRRRSRRINARQKPG